MVQNNSLCALWKKFKGIHYFIEVCTFMKKTFVCILMMQLLKHLYYQLLSVHSKTKKLTNCLSMLISFSMHAAILLSEQPQNLLLKHRSLTLQQTKPWRSTPMSCLSKEAHRSNWKIPKLLRAFKTFNAYLFKTYDLGNIFQSVTTEVKYSMYVIILRAVSVCYCTTPWFSLQNGLSIIQICWP